MAIVALLLIIAALVCFLVATIGVVAGRVSFGWLGLALLTVVQLLGALGG